MTEPVSLLVFCGFMVNKGTTYFTLMRPLMCWNSLITTCYTWYPWSIRACKLGVDSFQSDYSFQVSLTLVESQTCRKEKAWNYFRGVFQLDHNQINGSVWFQSKCNQQWINIKQILIFFTILNYPFTVLVSSWSLQTTGKLVVIFLWLTKSWKRTEKARKWRSENESILLVIIIDWGVCVFF